MHKYILAASILLMAACNSKYESYTDTIKVNGQNIFYAAEGCGKPVILLHGNGGSHNDLETMQHQLAQAGYRVYALDSRGQGANEPLPEYHYKDMAEDVLASTTLSSQPTHATLQRAFPTGRCASSLAKTTAPTSGITR